MNEYKNRINYLEKKYSQTNVAMGEKLFPNTVREINQTYNKNQQKRRVDAILNNITNKDSIKEEVHNIIQNVQLKTLCKNCKEEEIIAIIILYVQRTRNPQYRVNRTGLWKKYDLTWVKYALIMERLLKYTREKTKIQTNVKVDNEQLIRW